MLRVTEGLFPARYSWRGPTVQVSKTLDYWSEMCKRLKLSITGPKCASVQNSGLLARNVQVSKILDYWSEKFKCPKLSITCSKCAPVQNSVLLVRNVQVSKTLDYWFEITWLVARELLSSVL